MILEIDMHNGGMDVSYLNKEGNKALMKFPVSQYTQWQIDPAGKGTPGYIDISGKPVVQKYTKSFRTFDLLEFLHKQPKEVQDELFAYREANMIACDIETMIGDRFPKPELAEQPVNAISCVDKDMNIVIYTTKDCSGTVTVKHTLKAKYGQDADARPELIQMPIGEIPAYYTNLANGYKDKTVKKFYAFYDGVHELSMEELPAYASKLAIEMAANALDGGDLITTVPTGKWFRDEMVTTTIKEEVDYIIKEQIGHLLRPHEKIDTVILQFDTEKQMLEAWFGNVCKFAAVLSFWNGDGFDKPYLINRCARLGIPLNIGSITGEIASMTNTPKHTVFTDYMFMIDKYDRQIKNKESLKLDYISNRVLKIGKLPYRGTLKELEERDIPGFLAYNAIDSCLIQLIHRQLNLMATLYGFSQVCKLPLVKANSQVAQTESLISLDTLNALDTTGVKLPERPDTGQKLVAAFNPNRPPRRKYPGGHVKEPHKHVAGWNACIDFSGLYPSEHRSCNLSIENYICHISQLSPLQQKQVIDDKNYFVSANNNVYKNDRAYAYKRIQIYLRAKRDYHKELMNKHLSLQQPFIEYALWERGVWGEKANFDTSVTELIYPVWIDGKEYRPDLTKLNEPGDQDGYEHHTNFLWFLFHENLREGFFQMNMQVSFKLVANSLYGATANEWNSFMNCEVADDTTTEGRNAIVCAEKIINNWFNFEWATDVDAHKFLLQAFPGQCPGLLTPGNAKPMAIKDRVMYIDTDSLYIEYVDLIDAMQFTGDPIQLFVALYDGYERTREDGSKERVKGYLSKLVNARLHKMVNDRHGDSMQKFDLEHIARAGLFRKKKSYLKTSDWVDGRTYSEVDAYKHLKTTGFALARSFQSQRCRDVARDAIVEILQGKWQTQADYVANMMRIWQDFQTWPIEDISKRLSIRKDQYESHVTLTGKELPIFALRTLPQYKGAAWHNWHLRQRDLIDKEQDIDDGFVCFYEDTFGNPFAYRIFELPEWHPEPNKVIQFYKLIADVIRDVAIYYGIVAPLPLGDVNYSNEEDEEDA